MIQAWWNKLSGKYQNIKLDEYIIMPNHMHGIIFIVGADPCVCPKNRPAHTQPRGEHTGSPVHTQPPGEHTGSPLRNNVIPLWRLSRF